MGSILYMTEVPPDGGGDTLLPICTLHTIGYRLA